MRHFRVRTWNATVANLTLMALGSSAPEILLSVIELLSNGWYSGSLGPSTIVGSAAFNLFVIIAVCVVAIPADDSRKIAQPRVYAVTAFFSVFAYVWLVIVLLGTTPEIVDLPEAILTLFFFPLVVWMAYVVDKWSTSPKFKEKWSKRFGLKHEEASAEELLPSTVLLDVKHPDGSPLSADELLTMVKRLRRTATGLAVSEEKAVSVIAQQMASQQPKSRAYHRIAATRKTVGGKDLKAPKLTEDSIQPAKHSKGTVKIEPEPAKPEKPSRASATHSVVEWACDKYAVVEAAGTVTVQVRRDGALDQAVSVVYSSIDGTAKAGEDFELAAGTIDFAPGEDSHDITIKIFDDDEIEPDEVFTVALQEVVKGDASLGDLAVTQVTVINDDFPGTFVFEDEDLKVKEDVGVYMLPVQRVQGCSGAVSLKYATRDGSAKHGKNYEEAKGTLEWAHQDVQPKHIAIPITNDSVMSGNLFFEVEIHSATGDAQFDERTDGSKERSIARVTIIDDDAVKGIAERAINLLGMSQQTGASAARSPAIPHEPPPSPLCAPRFRASSPRPSATFRDLPRPSATFRDLPRPAWVPTSRRLRLACLSLPAHSPIRCPTLSTLSLPPEQSTWARHHGKSSGSMRSRWCQRTTTRRTRREASWKGRRRPHRQTTKRSGPSLGTRWESGRSMC